jgi:low temperature requirement protein LtrA
MVIQWLRAAAADPERRNTNLGYAAGIFVVQLGWIARLALPDALGFAAFFVLVAAELAVPLLTERQGMTPWHPHHVAERYGLFTIIVLGECVTAASGALRGLFSFGGVTVDLVLLSVGGLLLLFGMWWVYFLHDTGEALGVRRHLSFVWGYSHYLVFASAAAVGAGLEAASELTLLRTLDAHGDEAAQAASGRTAALAIAVAASVFLLLTSYVHTRLTDGHLPAVPETTVAAVALVAIGLILGNASLPLTVLAQGLVVALLVASAVLRDTVEEETP